jgi:hypothetical protein
VYDNEIESPQSTTAIRAACAGQPTVESLAAPRVGAFRGGSEGFASHRARGLRHRPFNKELDMRIFTLRRIIGITAIGVAYVHGKRGGDATLASISDTLRYLWSSAADRLGVAQREARPMPGQPVSSRISNPNGMPNERTPRPQGG